MIDPLIDFAYWKRDAPFLATPPKYTYRAMVLPAHCKTGLVTTSRSGTVHLCAALACVVRRGRARYGARYMCGLASSDASVVTSAEPYGGICAFCEDAAQGPAVYRCFNAAGQLLYIGSSEKPLKRRKLHEGRTPWWPEVASMPVERYPTIFEARAAERLAIIAENPAYNRLPRKRGAA